MKYKKAKNKKINIKKYSLGKDMRGGTIGKCLSSQPLVT